MNKKKKKAWAEHVFSDPTRVFRLVQFVAEYKYY